MRKAVIAKLDALLNEHGEKSKIDVLEETIADEIEDTIEDESFYSLPIEEIIKIVKKSRISEAPMLNKLVSSINKYNEEESPLILKAIEPNKMTFDECIGIISCLKNCPICTRIGQLYRDESSISINDCQRENEDLKKEIIKLKEFQRNKFPPVTKKPNDFESDIFEAISKGKLDSVQYHIEQLHIDVEKKNTKGKSLLNYASFCGRRKIVEYLFESCGADVESKDANGVTPFSSTALKGNIEFVEYLVEHCKVNINTKSNIGRTPIGNAARSGNLDVVEYLFEKCNANIEDGDNKGYTPLLLAAEQGHLDVVKYLVNNCRADINAATTIGRTPLHKAAQNGNLDIVKFLVEECRDDVEKEDNSKHTPLYIAAQYGNKNIVKYFVEQCHAKITEEIIRVSLNTSECLTSKSYLKPRNESET